MRNKLIENFKNKIFSTLEYLDVIEKDIERLADAISEIIQKDKGRIIFVGAGISADMAKIIIDEMWFNFQINENKFISVTAAKSFALAVDKWKELEEVHQTVVFELEEINLQPEDLLIGLSSSGKTKYVLSALDFALQHNCKTALITDMEGSEMIHKVDYAINTNFGKPTIIGLNTAEGATIQKIILDNIIYLAMEKSGRIYKDSLVYMKPASMKIEDYCINVVSSLLEVDTETAKQYFEDCEKSLELTLISKLKNVSTDEARDLIYNNRGNFNKIL